MKKAAASFLVASVVIVFIYFHLRHPHPLHHPHQTSLSPPQANGGRVSIPEPAAVIAVEPAEAEIPEPTPPGPEIREHDPEPPTAASLIRSLERDPDKFMLDDRALRALQSMGEDAVPDLRRALRHATPAVRWTACWTLEILESHAHAAVPDLTNALEDRSQRVQEQAAQALGAIGAAAANAIPRLTVLGKDFRVEPLNDIARVAVERIREALEEEED